MADRWRHKGREILFDNEQNLYIDGNIPDGVRGELYGKPYTRQRVKNFIDRHLDDSIDISKNIGRLGV